MPLTILEASKIDASNVIRGAIVEIYARTSPILQVMGFMNIGARSYTYNSEEELPGVGFRGINEAFEESVGVLNPQTETLAIAGGDMDVDRVIVITSGVDQRAIHTSMKVKAAALSWTANFIKGDASIDPRGFDGLQVRIVGDQLLDNSAAPGGAPLSLAQLDRAIDAVESPTHLIMNSALKLRLDQAVRDYQLSGIMQTTRDVFGRGVDMYKGLPIMVLKKDNRKQEILPFTEVSAGGGTAQCSSIYVASFEDGGVMGLQAEDMDVRDMGELQEKPVFRTRVEWVSGFAVLRGDAVSRLRGITDAPATK